MKQPPIKTKELSGSTVQIADGQNWEIASITAYGETPQGGTTEAPVALTGVDSVFVGGNNLLPNKAKTNTAAGITYTVNPDKSVTAKGTATSWGNIIIDADFSLPDGTYTLNSNTKVAGINLVIGKDTTGTKNIVVSSTASKTFTLSDPIKHYVAYISVAPDSVVDTTIYPMLNLGKTAMPYEPYQGSVTQLPIPLPLHEVGDVRDVCVTRQEYEGTEKLVVTYNVGFVELDGTEASHIFEGMFYLDYSASWPTPANRVNGVCSHYPYRVYGKGKIGITDNGAAVVYNPNGDYTSDEAGLEEWKSYLAAQKAAGTPVQIAYQFATPETYSTDPLDIDNAAGPLTVMTGGEVEVTLTHRMLTPYTAWTIQYDSEGEYTGDFFNVEDYDRIKQNIEYLREYAYFLYGGFTMRGMVAVTVESYGYASTIDALDANLEAIAANTFRPPDMMPVKQWRGNQPPPGADDWNRIENTCLLLFEQFERQFACLPKLAFELKGSAF